MGSSKCVTVHLKDGSAWTANLEEDYDTAALFGALSDDDSTFVGIGHPDGWLIVRTADILTIEIAS